jgi:hypothetical protein
LLSSFFSCATYYITKINLVAGETDLTIDAGLKPDNLASGTYMVRVETKSEVINTMVQVIK